MIEIIDIISRFVFAIAGITLAVMVYELNRQKFRLEIHERRMAAYLRFEEVLVAFMRQGGFPSTEEYKNGFNYQDFAKSESDKFQMESKSFFGYDVEQLGFELTGFVNEAIHVKIMCKPENKADMTSEDSKKYLRRDRALNTTLQKLWDTGRPTIGNYLKIDEPKKMPLVTMITLSGLVTLLVVVWHIYR